MILKGKNTSHGARRRGLRILSEYFTSKGKILEYQEFKDATDKPLTMQHVKSVFRSYPRMLKMLEIGMPKEFALIGAKKAPTIKATAIDGLKAAAATLKPSGKPSNDE
jgi:hypothetical protein